MNRAAVAADNECLGNATFGNNSHGACPAAITADTFSNEVTFAEGPVPAGGGTVTNLEATVSVAPSTGQSHTIEVRNLTTGLNLMTCTITANNTSCQNIATVAVPAGHYLAVRVQHDGGASDRAFRVTFRY